MPGPVFWFFPIIGLATLAVAIRFAFRPAERTLAILRPLSAATIATNSVMITPGGMSTSLSYRHGEVRVRDSLVTARHAGPPAAY